MSGEWTDHIMTTVENQRKCILPMNDISSTIFYNQRIVLSAPIKTPVTWHCSKVEQTAPKGVGRLTFAQEQWDEHKDAFEYEDGTFSSTYNIEKKIVGMWADYFDSSLPPEKPEEKPTPSSIYAKLSFSGTKPEIKSGGSYKKLTVTFFNQDGTEAPFEPGTSGPFGNGWTFELHGETCVVCECDDITQLISLLTKNDTSDVKENQIKVKFNKDDTYLHHILLCTYTSDTGVSASVKLEIVSL